MEKSSESHHRSISQLELNWVEGPVVWGKTLWFLDFVIDGQSLQQRICPELDQVAPLGWGVADYHTIKVKELQMEARPYLPEGNRRALFVCIACGDIFCGAVTALVTRDEDFVTWSEFAYYNPCSSGVNPGVVAERNEYEDIGPFVFDAESYLKTIASSADRRSEHPWEHD